MCLCHSSGNNRTKRVLIGSLSLLTTTVELSSFPSKTFKRKFKQTTVSLLSFLKITQKLTYPPNHPSSHLLSSTSHLHHTNCLNWAERFSFISIGIILIIPLRCTININYCHSEFIVRIQR